MDIEALRQQYLAEMQTPAAAPPEEARPDQVLDYASSDGGDPDKLCEMIVGLPLDDDHYSDSVRALLDLLGNPGVDRDARLMALRQLGGAEFLPRDFAAFHAEYIDLLRRLAVEDDKEIRAAAFERLTLTNDPEAHRLLREGLEKLRKPLVSAAKAVQLLARDEHGGALPVIRKLAATAKGQVREQALRALAGDSRSASLFERIAGDKAEKAPIREIAALNLKEASATRFAKLARALVLDEGNDDKLRAAAVSAIAHTGEVADKLATKRFTDAVEALGEKTGSRALKSSILRVSKALRDRL